MLLILEYYNDIWLYEIDAHQFLFVEGNKTSDIGFSLERPSGLIGVDMMVYNESLYIFGGKGKTDSGDYFLSNNVWQYYMYQFLHENTSESVLSSEVISSSEDQISSIMEQVSSSISEPDIHAITLIESSSIPVVVIVDTEIDTTTTEGIHNTYRLIIR